VPDQILLDLIKEDLPYEIDMLRLSYRRLSLAADQSPGSEAGEEQVLRYALIESFCVHARSLIDFFANRRPDPTDAVAGDFTDKFIASIDPSKQPMRTLRMKLNKQLFRLAQKRTDDALEKFDVGADGTRILQEIEPAIARFTACLVSDFRSFKCNTEPVTFVSTDGT
jgi:hypothetical protein